MDTARRTVATGIAALAALATVPVAPAEAAVVTTRFGAAYDPAVCHVSSAYWKGHRRFYLSGRPIERGCFSGPWFSGVHPVMLSFGRTTAPWYASHVHHGVDIDMPVGTPVRSAVNGTVRVRPASLGPAYGTNRILVRTGGTDYVLGHMSRLAVRDGQRVRAGQLLGWSGMSGVEDEDGPHLHFEARPLGKGYTSAVDPWWAMHLHLVR